MTEDTETTPNQAATSEQTEDSGPGSGVTTVRTPVRHRNRIQTGFDEFLARPLAVAAAWVVLAAVAVVHDRGLVPWSEYVRDSVTTVMSPESAGRFLTTVTPGLLTAVSIIFFVALMAVQHQSAKYSPVVLDQFMRHRNNQAFFGMFVGLSVYCLLVLGLVPTEQTVVSGLLALGFGTATLVLLLVFIYSTMDQMRPNAAAWVLQNMALGARGHYDMLLRRCRVQSRLREAPATDAVGDRFGYVVDLDVAALIRSLASAEKTMGEVEVELWTGMGAHVVPGAALAQVRGGTGEQRAALAREVANAITIGRLRDIGRDAGHAVNQLSSMAWSATAVGGDVEGARVAVEALHSVLTASQTLFHDTAEPARDDPGRPSDSTADGDELPLVYRDPVSDKAIDGLVNVVAASGRSGQYQSAADTLTVLSRNLPCLSDENQKTLIGRLERVLPTVSHHLFTVELEHAFHRLGRAMYEAGEPNSARRLGQIRDQLEEQHRLAPPD